MKYWLLAAMFALCPVTALSAQNMPLNQFLDKATALEKKGAMALFSSDVGRLKKEMAESGKALRAERLAAQAAGRKPAYCPPEKQGGLGVEEILGHLRAIPVSQRVRMTSKDGLRSLLARKISLPPLILVALTLAALISRGHRPSAAAIETGLPR